MMEPARPMRVPSDISTDMALQISEGSARSPRTSLRSPDARSHLPLSRGRPGYNTRASQVLDDTHPPNDLRFITGVAFTGALDTGEKTASNFADHESFIGPDFRWSQQPTTPSGNPARINPRILLTDPACVYLLRLPTPRLLILWLLETEDGGRSLGTHSRNRRAPPETGGEEMYVTAHAIVALL
ncbi:hypothetical protein BOTBODRAFT_422479 [Botryobasidium botryosum FD-172 SS1]|uniref:Uncharacterized protein n=1 Tax=Botryobasidium botryosum (strain FD-172 SS1) TaxID=930990 RepID=A0A067MLC5_BOTB1|nr:hypothetical protein BOTBODRAFT_422479 [Botryobasidium botryosum FD-172 SS1]